MPRLKKKTILLVDDEPDIRTLYSEVLQDRYKVITARDGEEGLRLIFEKKPDLVVLDIKMPKLSGLDVLRKSKRFFPSLPIILCTAFSSYRTVYAASLADAFVVKSPDFTELVETIAEILKS